MDLELLTSQVSGYLGYGNPSLGFLYLQLATQTLMGAK
jgi:hypothetical protein